VRLMNLCLPCLTRRATEDREAQNGQTRVQKPKSGASHPTYFTRKTLGNNRKKLSFMSATPPSIPAKPRRFGGIYKTAIATDGPQDTQVSKVVNTEHHKPDNAELALQTVSTLPSESVFVNDGVSRDGVVEGVHSEMKIEDLEPRVQVQESPTQVKKPLESAESPNWTESPKETIESPKEHIESPKEHAESPKKPAEPKLVPTEPKEEKEPKAVKKPPPGAVPMFGMGTGFKFPKPLTRSDSTSSHEDVPCSPPKPTRTPSTKSTNETPTSTPSKYPNDVLVLQSLLRQKDEEIEKLKARIVVLEKVDLRNVPSTTVLSHVRFFGCADMFF
jgi:hypothetical protein